MTDESAALSPDQLAELEIEEQEICEMTARRERAAQLEVLREKACQHPWPNADTVAWYQHQYEAAASDPTKCDRLREEIERNAMISLHKGDFDGRDSADQANRYRLLREFSGAHSIADLRPKVAGFLRREAIARQNMLVMFDAVHRISTMDGTLSRLMRLAPR